MLAVVTVWSGPWFALVLPKVQPPSDRLQGSAESDCFPGGLSVPPLHPHPISEPHPPRGPRRAPQSIHPAYCGFGVSTTSRGSPAGPDHRSSQAGEPGEVSVWGVHVLGPPVPQGQCWGPERARLTLHPQGEGKGVRQGWGQAEGRGPMTSLSCTKALLGSLCQATSLWASFPSVKWVDGSGGNPGPLCLKH